MVDSRETVGSVAREAASPPTARVVQVLDFLVHHQGQRFGLSELARRCRITKPTCLGIVTELTASGYLIRDPRTKSYGLGPALVAAGRAAQRDFALGSLVRDRLEGLSKQFDATCTASAVVRDEVMVLETITPPGAAAPATVGQVYPFTPPVGLMFAIWEPDEELDRWLRRGPALSAELDVEHVRRIAAECRQSGYVIESLTPTVRRLHRLMAGVAAQDMSPELRELVTELVSSVGEPMFLRGTPGDSDRTHEVSVLAAPTFDADGRQSMVLAVYVGGAISNHEITQRAAALKAVAAAVTADIGGRNPFER
ncbi:helix-turn-helix domain-containing protein [Nocardia vermiculata]|uniref:MarR family transcriptional regulator n=1 Tax=Nocardia vermiculata TaxID=257274 RepID=A0A846XZ13_9NOCA|nr:helix-turn-helix domain-containing protein [Nocardia vermiculata]NKY51030.1 MarR family transcriptional regulator [Nocardia vermiculata]